MTYWAHETAIVDGGATIGTETRIWHWTHVCAKALIGSHCVLGQNCYVADNVLIGDCVKIQNNVSLYDGVIIEDNVFCGPSTVFTNVVNPRAKIDRKHNFQKTLVKEGATIGANSTIVCGVSIGKYSFIGAGAVVNANVPDYALVVGVPSKQIGWMSEFGQQLDLPLQGHAKTTCPETGETYTLVDKQLSKEGCSCNS